MTRAPGALALCALIAAGACTAAPAAASGWAHSNETTRSGWIDASQATRSADGDPKVLELREEHPGLTSSASLIDGRWEVGYFAAGEEVALVVVDPQTGAVRESWTGYQAAWTMARGYPGAFGHKLNAPYVFLPLCALFMLGLVDWRRPWRVANLDLLVLLGFGASLWFFNRGEIGVSVPLQYPVLAYLLFRALWIGLRGRGEGLRPIWPASWLLIAALFLVGLRGGLNVADSGVIDVGYAGVVGADRIAHGEQLYGVFPEDISHGDTYGPVAYLAYVPFEAIWPWHGSWDDLPAAHGAAVFFDLATFALLFWLGLRLRSGEAGRLLAAALAFGWAAYPYTAYALQSNSNDTLVAFLLVATLLFLTRPAARGALIALGTMAKFAPALLVPMLATYNATSAGGTEGGGSRTPSPAGPPPSVTGPAGRRFLIASSATGPAVRSFGIAFIVTTLLLMVWPAIDPGLGTFWDRTIAEQADRNSPFSLWGQVGGLEPVRIAILVGVGALAVALAFWPKQKSLVQVAALGAALLIGLQLTAQHWFYLYIVWFFPLLLVSLAAPAPALARSSRPDPRGSSQPPRPLPRRRPRQFRT